MDPDELERYAREGRALSLDESVAYALEIPVDELAGPHEHVGGRRMMTESRASSAGLCRPPGR